MGLDVVVEEGKTDNQEPSEVDELENEVNSNELKTDQKEEETDGEPNSGNEGENEEDLLPERFKGKSRADIAKSYSELEKLLGRQSTELGELRKLAEKATETPAKDTKEDFDLDEFWEHPDKVIEKQLDSKVKKVEEKLSEFEQNQARQRLKEKHPDAEQVVSTVEFQNWVAADPAKAEKFRQANEGFDIDSANDLLTEWKAQQEQAKAAQQKKRDKDLKAAATETSSSGQSSKKVYRRADLQRLRIQDPDRFEALQDEIIKAYKEGRVR